MKRIAAGDVAAAWLALALLGGSGQSLADDTYYPYPMYERYWEDVTGPEAPGNGKAAPDGTQAPREAQPPPAWQRVPGFLFPKELGFGVAVGVPEDLFYLSGVYYRVREGAWQRSPSWRGPWKPVARAKLPPVLLERDLASIRRLRNREFREYWEKRESYPGRHFRPEREGGKKRPD